jgi:hypothetical protein
MPRRRRTRGLDILDDVVETAVDSLFDRAGDVVERIRDSQREAFTEEQLRQKFTCASCRKKLGVDKMEMLHVSNGFGVCKGCFGFMWGAAKEKMELLGKRTARAASAPRSTPGAAPPQPQREPPWEVLGIKQDATADQVKKAYRKLAMQWHPDTVGPQAPAGEKEQAHVMFQKINRAYKVMMSVRSAPEG